MKLVDFWRIGTEQWRVKESQRAALFYRLLGAADMHTRIRLAHTLRVIEQYPLPDSARILDAGCGEGTALFWLAHCFPGYHLLGVDASLEKIDQARRITEQANLEKINFQCADLQSLDYQAKFDLIFSIDVLEHIPDDEGVLRNLRQVLAEQGKLIIHVPLNRHQQRRVFAAFARHDVEDHVRLEYTEPEILAKVREAGFKVEQLCYTFGRWGELAWEINNLFWLEPLPRRIISLATFPLSFILGYWDVLQSHSKGNSLLIKAVKSTV